MCICNCSLKSVYVHSLTNPVVTQAFPISSFFPVYISCLTFWHSELMPECQVEAQHMWYHFWIIIALHDIIHDIAFDTVDHCVLIDRLKCWIDILGSAFDWFSCHLSYRLLFVAHSKFRSTSNPVQYGAPLGYFLGSVLFSLYLLPLCHIMPVFKQVSYKFHADDIHLYI